MKAIRPEAGTGLEAAALAGMRNGSDPEGEAWLFEDAVRTGMPARRKRVW